MERLLKLHRRNEGEGVKRKEENEGEDVNEETRKKSGNGSSFLCRLFLVP